MYRKKRGRLYRLKKGNTNIRRTIDVTLDSVFPNKEACEFVMNLLAEKRKATSERSLSESSSICLDDDANKQLHQSFAETDTSEEL